MAAPGQDRVAGLVLAAAVLGSTMAFLDVTAVNVALPVLQADLHATVTDAQWVVEAYALWLSALLLAGGALGDRFGRRRVFAVGVALFAAASAWCGLSPDAVQLIVARAVQGVGGAMLVPGSLALITGAFPEETRGKAIGTWSAASAITGVLGPLVGGWLAGAASWRWIFGLNVPLAALTLVLASRIPEQRDPQAGRLDLTGALLATGGLGALTFGLLAWPGAGPGQAMVWAPLGAAVLALGAFGVVEARSSHPMVPPALFRIPAFAGVNLLTLLLYAALGGAFFFVPFDLIVVQRYAPWAAGAAGAPMALVMAALSPWAGGLVARRGPRLPLVAGPAIAAFGFALYALPGVRGTPGWLGIPGGSYWTTFFPAALVLGLGMAITVAPLTTTVMGALPVHQAGLASGINNAVARVAGLLAVAAFGVVVLEGFGAHLAHDLASLPLSAAEREAIWQARTRLAEVPIPASVAPAVRAALRAALDGAFVAGFRMAMGVAAGLALASAGVAAVTLGGPEVPMEPADR